MADNRTVIEQALAESISFADAAKRVSALEREFERLRQQIDALESESRIIANHIDNYKFQIGSPVSQAILREKLVRTDAAATAWKKQLSEVATRLSIAGTERDKALEEFQCKLA